MSDTAQIIKEKLDIVDFLKQYVELKPAGKNFKALCPFHKEKTPSFMVSPERQTWHCFGSCSEGGDIIKFLMKYENIEFYDALKILAEKAGVDIQRTGGSDFKAHNVLYTIVNEAKNFFKDNLTKSEYVKKYVKERGLKPETVNEFELGLAPDSSDALTRHLLKVGYKIADIEKAGLAIKTERGTYWDRFRSRLMFPLYNHFGKVVGFTGRILPGADDGKMGKYINSPETPIFQKSKYLYGFHKTKNDIREAKTALLVEGQMDFLMIWQDSVKNAVATSGTALTADHLKILRRIADELILSFDKDEAGQAAAERAIDAAGTLDFSVKLLIIDDKNLKDPADVVKEKPGMMKKLAESAKSAMEYYFQKYLEAAAPKFKKDIRAKKNNVRLVLSKIKNISSAVERNHWIKELAILSDLDEEVLIEEMEDIKEGVKVLASDLTPEKSAENFSRKDLISQRLIGIALNHKEYKKLLDENINYLPPYYQDICGGSTQGDLHKMIDFISLRFSFDNGKTNIEKIEFNSDEAGAAKIKKEFNALLRELKIIFWKEKRQEISQLIKKLETEGNEQGLKEALKEFDTISKEMHNLGM